MLKQAGVYGVVGILGLSTAVLAHTPPTPVQGASVQSAEIVPHSDGAEGHHPHAQLEVPTGQSVPTVDLILHPDRKAGWNLELKVSHFRFAPEAVGTGDSSIHQGHAHLYVDGVKLTRLYGPWYYLESLPPGHHELRVELNSNNHETITYQGKAIQDTEVLTVERPNPPAMKHL